MIVYSQWTHRRRGISPPPLSGDSGNREQASHPGRHASVRPAMAKKPPVETSVVTVGLEQTEISRDERVFVLAI